MPFPNNQQPMTDNERRVPRVALLSESPADEAALRVLVGFVLGPVRIVPPSLRARGWPSVEQVLPPILRYLHFQTDADGIVVVVDSDDSVVHGPSHEVPGYHHPGCRLCRLRAVARRTLKNLPTPRPAFARSDSSPPARGHMRVLRAIGLAVPAIEAWLLCGRDPAVNEAAWLSGQESGRPPYTRLDLKYRVYGTDRPGLPLQTRRAIEEISRHRGDIRRLENDFPNGFGALARDLRDWNKSNS